MQTLPIFYRSWQKAELVCITCCLEWSKLKWMGVVGPLELLVMDLSRNSSFSINVCGYSLYPSLSTFLKVEIFTSKVFC